VERSTAELSAFSFPRLRLLLRQLRAALAALILFYLQAQRRAMQSDPTRLIA
jgi:hypothetical protein